MKRMYAILLLLSTVNFLSAMEQDKHMVMVPSQKVLLERLQPIKEYEHFFSTNNFIKTFASTKKYAPEVFACLGFQIDVYREQFKNDQHAFRLEMLKPKVVTLMLQDHPEAITFLKKEKILPELVLLPSPQILHEYLGDKFKHLATNTKLVQELANQAKYPTEIFMIVDSQVDEYVKKLSNQIARKLFISFIPTIAKTILQKHPEAIKFLIKDELLEE